jgi:ABC-type cobalamin/Fe3+-siderophores transport system ATPase subunit
MLARALAQQPRLLVLDEPNLAPRSALPGGDGGAAAAAQRRARHDGLLVSHDLNLAAEVCDRLLLLGGGRVARVGRPRRRAAARGAGVGFRLRGRRRRNQSSGRPVVQVAWPSVRAGR